MKKKLLSLIAMALVAIGMQAQTWTAPVAPDSPYEKIDYVADGTTAYYLYNVGCGQFVTGANAWATQISLGTDSKPYMSVVVEPLGEDEVDIYPDAVKLKLNGSFTFYGGNGYEGGRGISNTYMFRDGVEHGFVDRGSQASWYWNFTKTANGNYYWQSLPEQGFNTDGSEYAAGQTPGAPVVFNAAKTASNVEWQFVAVEGFDPSAAESMAALFEVYEAKLALYNLAVAIVDEGLEVDYEQYTSVYNGSDLEALKAAYEPLHRAYMEAKVAELGKDAAPDNPVDFTSMLVNPTFEGNINGWVCTFKSGTNATNIGYQGASYTNGDVQINKFIEAWANNGTSFNPDRTFSTLGNAELQQTVQYLPAGKYQFTVDCIAVQQWQSAENPVTGVQLFATGGEIDKYTEIHTGNEKPEHFEVNFASTGGDLVLGLRTRNTSANWIAADNFTLTYYGPVDPYQITLEEFLEDYDYTYDIDETMTNATVKENLETAIDEARAAIDDIDADYKAAYETALAALEAWKASANDYKTLKNLINRAEADAAAYAGIEGLGEQVSVKYDEYNDAYEDGTATAEQINEWIAGYNEFIVGAVRAALPTATEEKPVPATALGINMGYENNAKDGWTCDKGWTVRAHTAEVFHDTFVLTQTLENMPAGKYVVKAKAFYRTTDNENNYNSFVDGTDEILTFLTAGSNKAPVKNQAAGAIEADAAPYSGYAETVGTQTDEDGNVISEGSGIWVPNNMESAEIAFNLNDAYACEVSTYLVNDGSLTFGIRNDGEVLDNAWSIWSQFELIYYGKSASGLYEQLVALKDQATEMIEAGKADMVVAAGEKLNDAVNAAEAAKASDSEATLTNIINQLVEAMEYTDAGKALAEKLMDIVAVYDAKYAESIDEGIVSSDETFEAMLYEVGEAVATEQFESNEQIQAWVDNLPATWISYVMGQDGVETATAEEPADVTAILFNPDFDGGNANYWTVDAMGQNNGYQNNSTYTNDSEGTLPEEEVVLLDQFIECWRSGAILTDGAISQKLGAALPQGTYILQAEGHAVRQMGYPEGGIQGVNLTVTDGTKSWETPMGVPEGVSSASPARYQVVFESDGKTILTVGLFVKETNANWIAADNFKLFYAGSDYDAIESIAADAIANKPNAIYNLAGQRVQKAVKGLYIINGKKVVVK
ncbi:MAG: hypothetical protein J6Y04_04190 [Bacteroidaceae bacterium]|nr:hypothetical protein [Bacteroidaceae bacterium]